jgi:hypothetical protein
MRLRVGGSGRATDAAGVIMRQRAFESYGLSTYWLMDRRTEGRVELRTRPGGVKCSNLLSPDDSI